MMAIPINPLTVDEMVRFWSRVEVKPSGCWEWIGERQWNGYGEFRYRGFRAKVHRISFLIHLGREPLPCALHDCDNRPCVNPEHLFEGTHKDNTQDMIRKGRRAPTPGWHYFSEQRTTKGNITCAK